MYIPIRKTNLSSIKLKASSILVSRGWLNKTKNIGFQKLACITEMFVSARYYIICWQNGDNNPFIFFFLMDWVTCLQHNNVVNRKIYTQVSKFRNQVVN